MTSQTRPPDPLGKRALFSEPGAAPNVPAGTEDQRGFTVSLHCSACHEQTTLSPAQFLAQHFPVWVWLPWRRRSHFMRCPTCGRFAWQQVSLR